MGYPSESEPPNTEITLKESDLLTLPQRLPKFPLEHPIFSLCNRPFKLHSTVQCA